ncbi:MAG: 50S ribosomal protein L23 [Candidatus Magasanikbacteria bacterium CG10_big_fil_rev_8_21_14_0_10_47_10]|uniref:Large ribosomal subunit protein uL23 n=1 Tax=Candidatus Magasanikbacteria bacterium CG10_big_fil_rev_8_21_14_0_10_47_10 TaxID=1974652 RepID=A0A2H0TR31_9BACT|nr:MAG: 50S ribosomal protein L23 [Candidatus Magasanikbacteria bacterium CG10_big_fil_rev_8_21_14_0_10_47_10]
MKLLDRLKTARSAKEQPVDSVPASDTQKREKTENKTTAGEKDSAGEKKTVKPSKKKIQKNISREPYQVLIRPMLSEKTTMHEALGQYTFEVALTATKIDIKNAVEVVYGVRPSRVNVVHVQGKAQRWGRYNGRRSDIKKAMVTMPAGKKIDIHEGV